MITDHARLARAMNRLFWGTLVIVVDLRIESFDLILDPVGAWMIVSACQDVLGSVEVPGERRALGLLVPLATVSFVLSILGVFAPVIDEVATSLVNIGGALALARVLRAAFADRPGSEVVAGRWRRIESWLRVVLALTLILEVVGFLALGGPVTFESVGPVTTIFLVGVIVLSVVALIDLLGGLRLAERHLREEPATVGPTGASDGWSTST